jgi:K+-transporting ATPase KdpF subunit
VAIYYKILIRYGATLYCKKNKMYALILLVRSETLAKSSYSGYVAGSIIALFILGYLIYTLLKPEKF